MFLMQVLSVTRTFTNLSTDIRKLYSHTDGAWVTAVRHEPQLTGDDWRIHLPHLDCVCVAVPSEDLQAQKHIIFDFV